MNELLTRLAALGTPRDCWADASGLITSGYVESADADGIAVVTSTGIERLDVPRGMTAQVYDVLAPICSDDEKGILAGGVLQYLLKVDWNKWDRYKSSFYRSRKQSIEEWLSRAIEENGFHAVVALIKEDIAQLPALPPRTPTLHKNPKGHLLRYGLHEWTFTTHASTTVPILVALQTNKWKPVEYVPFNNDILTEMQIKFAVNQLNRKTKKVISWHALTRTYAFGTTLPNGLDEKRGPTRKHGETKITGVWWKCLL